MSNNGRKRLRGTAAAQANGPHEDAATGVVPPAAQAAAVLPAVAGGILAAAAPHAMAVPRVVIPSGCHLFGKPATTGLHDGRYTVPIRLAEGAPGATGLTRTLPLSPAKQKTTPSEAVINQLALTVTDRRGSLADDRAAALTLSAAVAKLDRTKLAKPIANLSSSDDDDVLEAFMEELDGQRAGVLSAKYRCHTT